MHFCCRKFVFALLLFLFILSFSYGQAIIRCDEEAFPGNLFTVTAVSSSGIASLEAEISPEDGKWSKKFRGFRYFSESIPEISGKESDSLECFIAILGVDPSVRKGKYIVTVTVSSGSNGNPGKIVTESVSFSVAVRERDFRRDTIPLSEDLSTLRTDDSEQRKAETEYLVSILNSFNTENLFSDSSVMNPIAAEAAKTSHYGDVRKFVYNCGEAAYSVHNGIDFAVKTGTPVHSSAAGRVVLAAERIITGNSVIIEHLPGFYSIYYHLDRIFVQEGDLVSKGSLLGLSGNTGLSTGPHLHWEMRNQMIPVDPEYFIARPIIDKYKIISIINAEFSDVDRGR